MVWEVLAVIGFAFFALVCLLLVLVLSIGAVALNRRVQSLQANNKMLAEEIVTARALADKRPTPVVFNLQPEMVTALAMAINNVRDSVNLPIGEVH